MVPRHGFNRKSFHWYRKRSPFLVKLTWEKTNQKGAGRYLPTGNHSGCRAVHIPTSRKLLQQDLQQSGLRTAKSFRRSAWQPTILPFSGSAFCAGAVFCAPFSRHPAVLPCWPAFPSLLFPCFAHLWFANIYDTECRFWTPKPTIFLFYLVFYIICGCAVLFAPFPLWSSVWYVKQ